VMRIEFPSDAGDGARIVCHEWPCARPRAIVVIAHGAAEHGLRYARIAAALNAAGFAALAIDHRGHGQTGKLARLGQFAAEDGWNRAVADLHHAVGIARSTHAGLPCILFGHSMGSLMAQQYLVDHGAGLDACVLSGSTLADSHAELVPLLADEIARLGREAPSELMSSLMGGAFNAGIENPRTPFDWLSRDAAEVQAYVDDPLCGFPLSCGAWHDLMASGRMPTSAEDFRRVPPGLPLLLLAGDRDPLNQQLATLHELAARLRAAGVRRVDERYYEGGRHEMLNETNREAVTADLLAWIGAVAAS